MLKASEDGKCVGIQTGQVATHTEPTSSMPQLFLLGLSVVLLMIKIDTTYRNMWI
jgi:hypothetical protein